MVHKELSLWEFQDEFRNYGRENQFSEEGLSVLYDYLWNMAEEMGIPYKLDVIGLCCEFTEFESIEEYNNYYGSEYEDVRELEFDETVIAVLDNGGFIVVAH
jgi:hypothetical protein